LLPRVGLVLLDSLEGCSFSFFERGAGLMVGLSSRLCNNIRANLDDRHSEFMEPIAIIFFGRCLDFPELERELSGLRNSFQSSAIIFVYESILLEILKIK
ncbi:unnamed protein product, partial [Owenia fusiformis]